MVYVVSTHLQSINNHVTNCKQNTRVNITLYVQLSEEFNDNMNIKSRGNDW